MTELIRRSALRPRTAVIDTPLQGLSRRWLGVGLGESAFGTFDSEFANRGRWADEFAASQVTRLLHTSYGGWKEEGSDRRRMEFL